MTDLHVHEVCVDCGLILSCWIGDGVKRILLKNKGKSGSGRARWRSTADRKIKYGNM